MTIHKSSKYFIAVTSVLLAFLTALSPFGIDTYLSAMPVMAKSFGVSIHLIEITLTLYFLGFATGNVFGGPMSDSFGRKKIALTGVLLYGLSSAGIPFAPNVEMVWLLRATQAFGGGFASVTAMVFVRDWFEGKQVAKLATLIGMIMMLAPLFAPVIGSFLLDWGGWHSIFFFLASYALVLFFIFLAVMPESRHHTHLTHRITKEQLIGKYRIFFSHRRPVLMLMTISFATAGMFTFITSSSFIYIEYYGFTHRVFPLLFGSNVVLYIALSLLNNWRLKNKEPEQMMKLGLIIQLIGGVLMLVGVSLPHPPFTLVFGAIVLFVGSLGLIFGNGTAVILNLMPEISGSANATIGVSRFILSFIAGTIPALFQSGDLVPIGVVMFSLSLLANLFYLLFKRS